MLRREVLQKLGYRDCGWPEDYDLLLRLLALGYEVSVVPRPLLSWRDIPGRLSRTSPTYALETLYRLQSRFSGCFLPQRDTDVHPVGLW